MRLHGRVGYSDWSLKLEVHMTIYRIGLEKTILWKRGRVDLFMFLETVDVVVEPNYSIKWVEFIRF